MNESRYYSVYLLPAAQKELDRMPDKLRSRIEKQIILLENEPRPHGCKKLSSTTNVYRIRVGNFRILYRVFDKERVVNITRIPPRSQAYR
ncbi:MAG: type II toxin-antitoxin system RelE/ParE family toxin [Calditrichaeota bacterium]|nr:type II toxin-antitoxin system RelE/ParE family toxin [Calditrichota bacterium]